MQINTLQPGPSESLEVYAFAFDNEQDLLMAKEQIESANLEPVPGPITLPNGEQVHLYPHERWFLEMLIRANTFVMLLTLIRGGF